jgi:branched-chain amino acid transport system ATP-binding protein
VDRAAPGPDVQLLVQGASKSFGGVQAVRGVDLSVHRGSIMSVIGPNGAGKTTLLNMVSGFYRPDEGAIVFEGTDITRLAPSRIAALGIARTFQNIALFRGLTVLDNLMLGRHVHMHTGVLSGMLYVGRGRREEVEHRAAVEDVIDFLEIEPLRRRVAGALPFGLQKRVELGRALAAHPTLLLLDEPMGGMNVEEKEDMARYILDVNEEWGTTIVLIEHDMGVVMDISQRIVVMDLGERIAEGSPAEVRADAAVIKAYLGEKAVVSGSGR